MSMLSLSPQSALVESHLTRLLITVPPSSSVDIRVGDFSGCYWRIEVAEDALNIIRVDLDVPAYAELKACVLSVFACGGGGGGGRGRGGEEGRAPTLLACTPRR